MNYEWSTVFVAYGENSVNRCVFCFFAFHMFPYGRELKWQFYFFLNNLIDGMLLIDFVGIKGKCPLSDKRGESSTKCIKWELRGFCFNHWWKITYLCSWRRYKENVSRTCDSLCFCYLLPFITETEGTGKIAYRLVYFRL